jgi:hypothetical protein
MLVSAAFATIWPRESKDHHMDWLSISGLIVGVVGIPVAFVVGRRNRQRPDLRVVTDFDQIVAPGDFAGGGEIKLAWAGRPLEEVSRTNIAFWNHRGDHVSGDDVLPADPLRIEVDDDDEILQVRVVSFSTPQNALAVVGTDIKFDYLDPGDGGVLEVLHKGESPARIVGTIPGARIRISRPGDLSPRGRANARRRRLRRMFWTAGRRSRPLALVALSALSVIALCIVGLIWFSREPALVAPGAYDLTSIAGQAEYARQISNRGAVGRFEVVMFVSLVVTYSLFFIVSVGLVLFRSRAAVPSHIVQNDADEKPANMPAGRS